MFQPKQQIFVAVVDINGKPCNPISNPRTLRKLMKSHTVKKVRECPFTIKQIKKSSLFNSVVDKKNYHTVLGIDTGYNYIGISIIQYLSSTQAREVLASTFAFNHDAEVGRNNDRKMYRRTRRNRLRYRKPRFDNRVSAKKEGWLPPSISNRIEKTTRLVKTLTSIFPVDEIHFELAKFDISAIKALDEGKTKPVGLDYQKGEMSDFDNTLRDYVFYRDNHKCQIPKCPYCHNKTKNVVLRAHHFNFWKPNYIKKNSPSDLITVCAGAHNTKEHQPGGLLYGWDARKDGKIKSFASYKEATFMNICRARIYDALPQFTEKTKITYGSSTKKNRIELDHTALAKHGYTPETKYNKETGELLCETGFEKSHCNDALCIALLESRPDIVYRAVPTEFVDTRKQNRQIQIGFYDAKYVDSRDGKVKSGKELFSGRSTRNKKENTENLRIYRKYKISKGRFQYATKKKSFRPGDIFEYEGNRYICGGTTNASVVSSQLPNKSKTVAMSKVKKVWREPGRWRKPQKVVVGALPKKEVKTS